MRLTVPEEVVVAKVVIAVCNVERNQPRVLVKPARNANNAAKAVAKPFDVSSGSVLTTPLKFVFVIALPSMLELRDEATLIVLVELATPILLANITSRHYEILLESRNVIFVYLYIEKNGTSIGAALFVSDFSCLCHNLKKYFTTQPLTEYGYDFVLE
ncbi:hypothetical protein GQX74_004650 [Glossina fuscipes]|nr:hypothetical protein GQX74_004650 [Glossina fuscipes]